MITIDIFYFCGDNFYVFASSPHQASSQQGNLFATFVLAAIFLLTISFYQALDIQPRSELTTCFFAEKLTSSVQLLVGDETNIYALFIHTFFFIHRSAYDAGYWWAGLARCVCRHTEGILYYNNKQGDSLKLSLMSFVASILKLTWSFCSNKDSIVKTTCHILNHHNMNAVLTIFLMYFYR